MSENESSPLFTRKQALYSGEAARNPSTPPESHCGSSMGDEECLESGERGGRSSKGLSMGLAATFLMAEMAGAGILSLPRAVANTGWVGVPLMAGLCVAVGYAGTRLALCWVILEERWAEYRTPCRRPYPAIAFRALGKPGQIIAEVSLNITMYGAATVYLLVTSQMLFDLFSPFAHNVSNCAWTLILGAILCPTTWLSSPKDFWLASVFALSATVLACMVVIVEVFLERKDHDPPTFPPPTFDSFFLGFGATLFALGGASMFPTIQNDMADRSQFPQSVIVTFIALMGLYVPMSVVSYGYLGFNGMEDNILEAVSGPAVTVTRILIVTHFVFAFSIVINPVDQTFEALLRIPNKFGVKRVVLRTTVMASVVVTAFTIPQFSKILDLIGGSTITTMSFIMPPLCYLLLCTSKSLEGMPYKVLALWEKVLLCCIIVVGVTGGVASTWSAISNISKSSFRNTCFSSDMFYA